MIVKRLYGWPFDRGTGRFEEFGRMLTQMSRLFDGLTDYSYREPRVGVFPLTNVTEDRDSYYVKAELPGINTKDLDISVTQNSLSISGERTIPNDIEGATYHRREREAGKFSRMISLPTPIDTARVEARTNNGILTVVLPKAESAKPRQISVKTS
jgi:HSP20 family protein